MIAKVVKIFLSIVGVVALLVAVFILVATVFEYRPDAVESIEVIPGDGLEEVSVSPGEDITVMTWNIGYGCLGDNADFFMDGGSGVKTADKDRLNENMSGIAGIVQNIDPDIAFFQEADINSTRSEFRNEMEDIKNMLPGYDSAFAYNYNALFVPYPIPPIGHVESGIAIATSTKMEKAERHSLPVSFKWPVKTVNLKRCMLTTRIPLEGTDKELVLVNFHLEAYDDGEGKKAQTAQLRSFLEQEADAGNYVIAGGDFNQTFNCIDTSAYSVIEGSWQPGNIDEKEFENNFNIIMDNRVPSCRSLKTPYRGVDPSQIQFYVIDGFIVSDNFEILDYETIDGQFKYSDHNPLVVKMHIPG